MDESTYVTHMSQLMVFVRYIVNKSIKEEFLFCETITTTTKSVHAFDIIHSFCIANYLEWIKLISVSTDGAPSRHKLMIN